MKKISTVYPENKNFLNINDIDEFSRHIDPDLSALKNEFIIIKPMLQSKTINEVIEFLNELLSLSNASTNITNDSKCYRKAHLESYL